MFVTKFNSAGDAILYSTVLGGRNSVQEISQGFAIVVDAAGRAVVAGTTDATDFPTKNALQPKYGGGNSDAFVAKLNPDGSALIFSTYLGGSKSDFGRRLALDNDSNIYVAGQTGSSNFPTVNALQTVYGGGRYDAFVTKMDADGTRRVFSSYFGGSDLEAEISLAVDPSGQAYVAGTTASQQDGTILGGFLAKFSLSGSALEYSKSSLLDGSYLEGIAVDSAGAVYLTGWTASETLATTPKAFQPSLAGGRDVFVAKLDRAGSAFEYLTYVGGTDDEYATSIALDRNGNAYVAGSTSSANFPTADPLQAQNNSPAPAGQGYFV